MLLIAENRSASYPDVPTLKDFGYDIPVPTILNVVGPKGMPEDIVRRLEEAFTKAMGEPGFKKGMKELYVDVAYRNSTDLTDYVARTYEAMGKILKQMGFAK